MRRLYVRLYVLFVVVIMSFTIGAFIFNTIGDIDKEVESSEVAFAKFEKAIDYEVQKTLLNDKTSRDNLRKLADILSIRGFVIQISPNTGAIFSYPSDSSLFSVVNGSVLVKEQSLFLKVFKSEGKITVEGKEQKIYITLLKSIFPKDSFFMRSRTVFFVMLTLVLLTCFVLVFLKIMTADKIERIYTSFDDGKSGRNNGRMHESSSNQTFKPSTDKDEYEMSKPTHEEHSVGAYESIPCTDIQNSNLSFSHGGEQNVQHNSSYMHTGIDPTLYSDSFPSTYKAEEMGDLDKANLNSTALPVESYLL